MDPRKERFFRGSHLKFPWADLYEELKKVWKLLDLKGHVKNYSSKSIWVLETDSGLAIAHLLKPMTKSPPLIDAEIFDQGDDLRVSVIAKTAVGDEEFDPSGGGIKRDQQLFNNLERKGQA